ncbi:MAG TPA: DinB family protein [Acidimicrobiales bacterium]
MDNMTDPHDRTYAPERSGEYETISGFLDFQRATFEWKCRGLSDDQLRVTRPPSTMSLGSIMKHLALVEDYWFTVVVGEHSMPEPWASADTESDPDWEWHSAVNDTGEQLRRQLTTSVDRSRAVVDGLVSTGEEAALSATHPERGSTNRVSLRWVLVHMIEEYARHNGHADLLRESIDGETGE